MTIYDLLLYIALAALPFWGLFGVGHAKLKHYEKIHYAGWYWQYFVGCLLVFSGFVKAVDPLGTAYKMKDYFLEFKNQGLPMMDTMVDLKVSFSVLMIVVELVVGLFLILGIGGRKTLWVNLLMMLFFTFLTGFNYLTGFTPKGATAAEDVGIFQFGQWAAFSESNIRITDCGCFGDFLKLKPIETFLKDIFLTGISVYFMTASFRIKELLPSNPKLIYGVGTSLTLASLLFCFNNFLWNDAFIDFRPFAEGVNIKAAKEECKKNAPVVEMTFIYKDSVSGQTKEFDAKNLPKAPWKYVDRKDKVIKEGCKSKVMEFNQFMEIEDYTQFPELEKSNGYAFLVVIPDLDKTDLDAVKKIADLCRDAEKSSGIPSYCLYFNVADRNGNGSEDEIEAFRQANQAPFYPAFGDEKLVLTIMRADPGLILFHKGTIIKKWHHKQLPSDLNTIKSQYFK